LKDLDTKYLGISSLDRGSYNETWALTNAYSELLVNQFQKANDLFLWQQESGSISYGGTCAVGGLNTIISGSTAGVVVPAGSLVHKHSLLLLLLTVMDDMIAALSSDVADRDDLTFFMSVTNFRKYVTALRSANNFYFDPMSITNRGSLLEMMYPFQNVKVVGTAGLQGSDRVVLGPAKQIVVGTDLLSDFSEFQFGTISTLILSVTVSLLNLV
jgi:hypothetical protein